MIFLLTTMERAMKKLLASAVAFGLMVGAANAAGIGVQVGPIGVGIGNYHHHNHWYHHRHWERDHYRYW
jgi:hypothetical protein